MQASNGTLKLTTDAYVTFTLGGHSEFISDIEDITPSSNFLKGNTATPKRKCYSDKTRVARKSLDPEWKEEFRLDVADDTLLQDEPLIFKVFDADAISNGDGSIGSVYVDLNPLLMRSVVLSNSHQKQDHVINGWFPIFCPIDGVRYVKYATERNLLARGLEAINCINMCHPCIITLHVQLTFYTFFS